MSQAVFPVLAGLAWNVMKTPQWQTRVQTATSGAEIRAAYMTSPIWKWTLTFDVLRADAANLELQNLVGFYNARRGRFDSFLYTDPTDNAVSGQQFGTGDGTTKAFQLNRDYGAGGFTANENVYDLNGAPAISVAGVLKTVTTDYTVSSSGLVTFVTAPANGAALTWSGNYYWRVRFDADAQGFNNFASQLWEAKSVSFVTAR